MPLPQLPCPRPTQRRTIPPTIRAALAIRVIPTAAPLSPLSPLTPMSPPSCHPGFRPAPLKPQHCLQGVVHVVTRGFGVGALPLTLWTAPHDNGTRSLEPCSFASLNYQNTTVNTTVGAMLGSDSSGGLVRASGGAFVEGKKRLVVDTY